MRSRTDARCAVAMAVVLTAALSVCRRRPSGAARRGAGPSAPDRPRSRARSRRVKADPNLATERTIKTLRWKDSTERSRVRHCPGGSPGSPGCSAGSSSRRALLVWVRGGGAGRRCWSSTSSASCAARACRAATRPFVAPTHVRDLDIRPESLPADIGAAARALWDRGEHRAALALLYRGMLSRLAHVHRVPIRDSSTEGDCLALAASHLTQRTTRVRVAPRARVAAIRVRRPGRPGGDGVRPVRRLRAGARSRVAARFAAAREARHDARANRSRCSSASRWSALVAWVASNTYWGDIKVPMPPKGEALTNPFYAVQRFAEALGARTAWDRVLTDAAGRLRSSCSPRWHWNLSRGRREALERWVESGGRLVVDRTLVGGEDEFERWSGIVREYRGTATSRGVRRMRSDESCRSVPGGTERDAVQRVARRRGYSMCDLDGVSFAHEPGRNAAWALRDASGIQAMRVAGRSRQRDRHQRDAVPLPEPVRRRSRLAVRRPPPSCGAAMTCTSSRKTITRRCSRCSGGTARRS